MKKIILILICVVCIHLLCSCSSNVELEKANQPEKNVSMFVEIEKTDTWKIVYHKETKVMYAISFGIDSIGIFTLLVNADGTPMLYKGGD